MSHASWAPGYRMPGNSSCSFREVFVSQPAARIADAEGRCQLRRRADGVLNRDRGIDGGADENPAARNFSTARSAWRNCLQMIIKPKIRGFICVTAHPEGCAAHVREQID